MCEHNKIDYFRCILLAAEARVKSLDTIEDTRQNGQIIYKTRIEMTAFSLYGNSYLHFNYDLKYCQGPCPQVFVQASSTFLDNEISKPSM